MPEQPDGVKKTKSVFASHIEPGDVVVFPDEEESAANWQRLRVRTRAAHGDWIYLWFDGVEGRTVYLIEDWVSVEEPEKDEVKPVVTDADFRDHFGRWIEANGVTLGPWMQGAHGFVGSVVDLNTLKVAILRLMQEQEKE